MTLMVKKVSIATDWWYSVTQQSIATDILIIRMNITHVNLMFSNGPCLIHVTCTFIAMVTMKSKVYIRAGTTRILKMNSS